MTLKKLSKFLVGISTLAVATTVGTSVFSVTQINSSYEKSNLASHPVTANFVISEWNWNQTSQTSATLTSTDNSITIFATYTYDDVTLNSISTTFSDNDSVSLKFQEIKGTSWNTKSIKKIAINCFSSQQWLTSIEIPSTVTTIASNAFSDCRNLASVTFQLNSVIEEIDDYAFADNYSIQAISFPRTLVSIGSSAFRNAFAGVTDFGVVFESGSILTEIKDSAFEGAKIGNITLPETLSFLGENAFRNSRLKTVNFFENSRLEIIPESCFDGSNQLQNITLPESITTIARRAFKQTAINKFNISGNVTSIGEEAFINCNQLQEFTFAEETLVTEILMRTFSGCSQLISFIVPEGITSIATRAFENCVNLRDFTIPESIQNIGNLILNNTYRLTNLTINQPDPNNIQVDGYLFELEPGIDYTIWVPTNAAISLYENSYMWKQYRGHYNTKQPPQPTSIKIQVDDKDMNLTGIEGFKGSHRYYAQTWPITANFQTTWFISNITNQYVNENHLIWIDAATGVLNWSANLIEGSYQFVIGVQCDDDNAVTDQTDWITLKIESGKGQVLDTEAWIFAVPIIAIIIVIVGFVWIRFRPSKI